MTSTPSRIGLRIDNKYIIEAELGSGGMATVYRATRLLIGDSVAIKILHPGQVDDRQSVERFRREAQAAARLKHSNVVPIYDFGVASDGLVYLVMELVEGKSIRDMLREHGPFAPKFATDVITQVCSALEAAHKKNVVHRDIKPDNIVVDAAASGVQVKVLDFGIAWMRDIAASSLTETGNIVGTPHYMSPEQCLGEEPDPRSDIYSVGVVLFEMLAGVVPFNARASTAVAIQHVNQPPPSLRAINSSVPPAVEAVVMHALAKPRDQRPQSAALLAAELTAAVAERADRPKRAISNAGNVATTVKMPSPDWSGGKQNVPSRDKSPVSKSWMWGSAVVFAIAGITAVYLTESRDGNSMSSAQSSGSVFPINSQSESTEIASHQQPIVGVDAPHDTSQPVAQKTEEDAPTKTKEVAQQAADSALKGPVERKVPPQALPPRQAASKTPIINPPVRVTRDLASRNPTTTSNTATNTGAPPAPLPAARATNVAVPNVDATKTAEPKDVVGKDVTPPNATAPKPNLAPLATQAASTCLSALRSTSVERMAQLYPTGSGQDKTNREKLLARMKDAGPGLTVTGSPDISSAQTFEDSAYTDLLVRLAWRGNFGQTVNKTARFRAMIARTNGDSHISCRIIGKADL